MRSSINYAISSDSYLSLALPEVFTETALSNVSTEALTLMYSDLRNAIAKANKTHQYIGNAATHLAWESIASCISNIVTTRNQPSWRARPR